MDTALGVLPTLLVMTEGVAQMVDEERSSLLLQHAVPEEWLLNLPCTGLPMLHPESRDKMNMKLLEFIEEIL